MEVSVDQIRRNGYVSNDCLDTRLFQKVQCYANLLSALDLTPSQLDEAKRKLCDDT